MGGASVYCRNLNTAFGTLTFNSGVGLRIKNLYMNVNNASASAADNALASLQSLSEDERLNSNNTSAKKFNGKTLYQSCIENFNSIINGTSVNANDVRADIVADLSTKEDFMRGVAAYAPKGDKGDKGDTGDTGPQGPAGTDGPTLDAVITDLRTNHLDELRGATGQTAWHAYCSENNNDNLNNIIKKLYPDVTSCDNFTATQYSEIMGGASVYCRNLNTAFGTLTFNSGVGLRVGI